MRAPAAWAILLAVLSFGATSLSRPPPALAQSFDDRQSFATPEAAGEALKNALASRNADALRKLFGADSEDVLIGADRATARAEWRQVSAMLREKLVFRRDAPDRVTLVIGKRSWPMAIPVVRQGGRWAFDTEAGERELLARRIGRNELAAIDALKAFTRAQAAYAARLRDRGMRIRYASYVQSTSGATDGLWWDGITAVSEGPSPLAKFVEKQKEFLAGREPGDPFHGYYFRILKGQGPHAAGGAMSYIVDGEMTEGYAMIAWPAEYGTSGIMTFQVARGGPVLQKDLGDETASVVSTLHVYDPDETWSEVEAKK
jgi:hypothetical protein